MNKTVCVVGLGYIGLPTAAILADKGFIVHGVDILKSKIETINSGKSYFYEPGLKQLIKKNINNKRLTANLSPKEADIFIIAVPTPFKKNYTPNIDFVIASIESILPYIKKNNIIIIESTIPVGTTKKVEELLKNNNLDTSNIHIAHCPERVLPGNIIKELKENDRIVGGTNLESTKIIANFYKSFVRGEVFITDDKTAELAKLTENSFRDVNIAFANELSMICEREKINVWDLIKLANKHPRVNILNPGAGVGGHCIAVDPWFIIKSNENESKIIKKAREVNLNKTKWVIEKIKKSALSYEKKKNKKPTICCMGLSYKPDVNDLRESPSIQIVQSLLEQNFKVIAVEPNIDKHKNISIVKYEEGIRKADIIVWLVAHKEFKFIKRNDDLDFCGISETIYKT